MKIQSWNQRETKAKKEYACDYCGNVIAIGETYQRSTRESDGRMYDWKCHRKCHELANIIRDFSGIVDGALTRDDFANGLREVADAFICAGCPHHGADGCSHRFDGQCIDHMHEFLVRHKLERNGPGGWTAVETRLA